MKIIHVLWHTRKLHLKTGAVTVWSSDSFYSYLCVYVMHVYIFLCRLGHGISAKISVRGNNFKHWFLPFMLLEAGSFWVFTSVYVRLAGPWAPEYCPVSASNFSTGAQHNYRPLDDHIVRKAWQVLYPLIHIPSLSHSIFKYQET